MWPTWLIFDLLLHLPLVHVERYLRGYPGVFAYSPIYTKAWFPEATTFAQVLNSCITSKRFVILIWLLQTHPGVKLTQSTLRKLLQTRDVALVETVYALCPFMISPGTHLYFLLTGHMARTASKEIIQLSRKYGGWITKTQLIKRNLERDLLLFNYCTSAGCILAEPLDDLSFDILAIQNRVDVLKVWGDPVHYCTQRLLVALGYTRSRSSMEYCLQYIQPQLWVIQQLALGQRYHLLPLLMNHLTSSALQEAGKFTVGMYLHAEYLKPAKTAGLVVDNATTDGAIYNNNVRLAAYLSYRYGLKGHGTALFPCFSEALDTALDTVLQLTGDFKVSLMIRSGYPFAYPKLVKSLLELEYWQSLSEIYIRDPATVMESIMHVESRDAMYKTFFVMWGERLSPVSRVPWWQVALERLEVGEEVVQ